MFLDEVHVHEDEDLATVARYTAEVRQRRGVLDEVAVLGHPPGVCMSPEKYDREFFYGPRAVGLLHESTQMRPGQWRYEPYRGPGHYDLVTDTEAGKRAECWVDEQGVRIQFVVTGLAGYGVLNVDSVEPTSPSSELPA